MNKKIIITLAVLSGYSTGKAMIEQTFDFERRYGVDSPIMNVPEYFGENKDKEPQDIKKSKQQNKKKESKKQGQKTTRSNK